MPDAARIMDRVRACGANVMLDGRKLTLINRQKLSPQAIAFIRENAASVADFLAIEGQIEERSAIMEHDGGVPRDVADFCARQMILGLPRGLSECDRGYFIAAIGRIAEEVLGPARVVAKSSAPVF